MNAQPIRRLRNPASLVFIGALLLQITVLSRLASSHHLVPASDDMRFYLDWAFRIASGGWTDHQAFYGLPGYAYWLSFLLLIASGDAITACLLSGGIQAVAFAGVAALIFLFARDGVRSAFLPEARSQTSERTAVLVGVAAATGWMAFAPAQAYSAILMPTVGVVLAYWFGVRAVSRATTDTSNSTWFLLGLLVGVSALFVATIFFLLPLAFLAILREQFLIRTRHGVVRGVVAGALLSAGVLAGCAPAWLHNSLVARDPVMLSAHSGINMWIGNNPVANGYPKIPAGLRSGQEGLLRDSLAIPEKITGRSMLRSEVSEFWSSKAKKWISAHPGDWLRLVGTKLENFWNEFQYDDINVLRLLQSDGVTFGFSSFGLISALGLAGFPLAAWHLPYSRWATAGVLFHMFALIPVFVTERYRLAAVPGLLICGSLGLWLFWRSLAAREWTPTFCYLLLISLAAAFVSIPKGDPGAWALSHYNLGVRTLAIAESAAADDSELAQIELARSQRELETAFAYAPASTEINLALGNLWRVKRDTSRSVTFYSRVLSIDPTHLSALNNLGVVALESQRWDLARQLFSRTIEIEAGSARAYFLLAKAELGSGNLRAAHSAIEAALVLRPKQKEFLLLQRELEEHLQ